MYSSVRINRRRCTKVIIFAINAKNNLEKDSLGENFDMVITNYVILRGVVFPIYAFSTCNGIVRG